MHLTLREPSNAITHFAAMVLAILAATPLIMKAVTTSSPKSVTAMIIFIVSMILLYGASALYHSVNFEGEKLKIFKRIDHMMIFVLIAGSYTPVCLLVLGGSLGLKMLITVWSIAVVGIIIKMFWITCPKWFSSMLYISMGWVCVFSFGEIMESLTLPAFLWLLAGGIIYTIGGVIYALKLQVFNSKFKDFSSHTLFHLFVIAGSICHFIFMYNYVL